MEEKLIIGFFSAFILIITATFINSQSLSTSQKTILVILIIFPPAQWILGIIFLNLSKKDSSQKLKSKKRKKKKSKGGKFSKRKKNKNKQIEKIIDKKKKTRASEKLNTNKSLIKSKFKEKSKLLRKELKMKLITDIEYDFKLKILKDKKEKELLE